MQDKIVTIKQQLKQLKFSITQQNGIAKRQKVIISSSGKPDWLQNL